MPAAYAVLGIAGAPDILCARWLPSVSDKRSQRPGFLNWLKQKDNQFAAVRLLQLSSRAFARIMFLCSAHMHPLAGSQDPCLEFMQSGLESCRPNQPNMVGMTMVKHSHASDVL